MALNNLRVISQNKALTVNGSSAAVSLNDYKSQTDSGTSFTITTGNLAGPIAVVALLAENTGSATMTITDTSVTPSQYSFTDPSISSFTSSTTGYGGTKYVVGYINTDAPLTSTIAWTANTSSIIVPTIATSGQRVGFLELYQWSATAPTIYPSGTSTYTWSTGSFTLPATLNGWSRSPYTTALGQTLWAISIVVEDSTAAGSTSVVWNSSSPYSTGYIDSSGTIGARVSVLDRYKWATSPGTYPSGNSTYTWSTGSYTNPITPGSWTAIPGNALAPNNLYIVRQITLELKTSFVVTFPATTKVSKFIIGNYWTPKYNIGYGAQVGYDDLSTSERTQSGDLYSTIGPRHKTLQFNLDYIDETDKFSLFDIIKSVGKSKPLFVSLFPDDTDKSKEQMYSIYGKLTQSSAITNSMYSMYSSSIQLEEI